jgi:hypothetical protein
MNVFIVTFSPIKHKNKNITQNLTKSLVQPNTSLAGQDGMLDTTAKSKTITRHSRLECPRAVPSSIFYL